MEDTALFIGTFDPFHLGHVWQIERTYKHRHFDKLVIAVIKQNDKKSDAAAYEHRDKLVRLHLKDLDFPFDIEITSIDKIGSDEISRLLKGKLKNRKVFRTVGSDSIINIIKDSNRSLAELSMFHYVIGVRELWNLDHLNKYIDSLDPEGRASFSYDILPIEPKNNLTATHIRHNLDIATKKGLINIGQLEYISSNNLYK